jgi:hypothetical protein
MERTFTGKSGRTWTFDPDARIGEAGGFGSVYRGRADDGTPVAVKVVPLRDDISAPRLLQREAEIGEKLRSVQSDYLIPVFDSAESESEVLLVMELAERSLAAYLDERGGSLPSDEALSILRDVTTGLRELHQASVIHRDLKPENVLLREGRWKLADFGIARDADIGTQSPTFLGWGSRPYMAPETWRGLSPTFKTDLYSLGCVAYQLMSGRPPFRGSEAEDFRRQHLEESPPELTAGPLPLRRIVLRLLSKDPAERQQDARAVQEALMQVVPSGEQGDASDDLAELAMRHSTERAAEQAAVSAAREAEDRRAALLRQANVDLEDVLQEAVEDIQRQIPEVTFEWRGTVASVAGEDATLDFRLHVNHSLAVIHLDTGVEGDTAIGFAEVTASNRRGNQGILLADLVYEDEGEGLFRWMLYRFRPQGGLRDYPLGPMNRDHGLSLDQFVEHRKYMLGSATHIFVTIRDRLTPPLVRNLYAEALALPTPPH